MDVIGIARRSASRFREAASKVRGLPLRNGLILCAEQREFFVHEVGCLARGHHPEIECGGRTASRNRDRGETTFPGREPDDCWWLDQLAADERMTQRFYELASAGLSPDHPLRLLLRAQQRCMADDGNDLRAMLEQFQPPFHRSAGIQEISRFETDSSDGIALY